MIASASLRFCPRFGRRPRDIVAGHGSLLTLRWREADSNHQSREAGDRRLGRMIFATVNFPNAVYSV